MSRAPKELNIPISQALEKINEFDDKCRDFREKEEHYKFQQDIFEIEPMEYRDLALVEKENGILRQLWEIKEDWQRMLETWYPIQFYGLNISEMELQALDVKSNIEAIEASYKDVKSWPLTDGLKTELKNFLETLPLLDSNMGLMQKAMRERHWRDLKIELKDNFDEHSAEFNLEKILSLDLL